MAGIVEAVRVEMVGVGVAGVVGLAGDVWVAGDRMTEVMAIVAAEMRLPGVAPRAGGKGGG